MFKRLIQGTIVFGVAALAPPALAQNTCAPRDVLVSHLSEKYGEALSGGGVRSSSQLLEVWSAAETGSWTVLLTNASGLSCIVASGTNWHQQTPQLPVRDIPS